MSVDDLHTNSSMTDLPEAHMRIGAEGTPAGIDYNAPVKINLGRGSTEPTFEGHVVEAFPDGDTISLHLNEGLLLTESAFGFFKSSGLDPAQVAYMAARAAGLTDERIRIPSLNDFSEQVFEIVTPVNGVEIIEPSKFGSIWLVPASAIEPRVRQLLDEDEYSDFMSAPAYGLSYETESLAYRAEQAGLRAIDDALAWLSVRLRYGMKRLPGGPLQSFSRPQARARPSRYRFVTGRGLLDGAHWIRDAATEPLAGAAHQRSVLLGGPQSDIPLELRQAVLAAQRAATTDDPVQRAASISEAIEFLVREVRPARVLTPSQRKEMRAVLQDKLPMDQHDRIERLIGLVNSPSLKTKLRLLIQQDNIPFDEYDESLLEKIRDVRNDAMHGRGAGDLPDPEEFDHALGLLSRLIVYRLHALTGKP